jgi:Na+/phosphate symporter
MSLGNKENSNNEEWVNKSPKKEQLLEFKESINTFFQKMHTPAMKPWYEIIQKRSEGHATIAESLGVKVDDYNYWANSHLEEYLLRIKENNHLKNDDPMRLDIDDIKRRISVFNDIIEALVIVIKKAIELKLNITHEMANDYHAAVASKMAAELALKHIN